MINDNPELMAELEEKVREALMENANKGKKSLNPFAGLTAQKKDAADYEADNEEFENMAAEGDDDFFEEDIEIED